MDILESYIQSTLVGDTLVFPARGVADLVASFPNTSPRIYYRNPAFDITPYGDSGTGIEIPLWPEVTHWCPTGIPQYRGQPSDETYQIDLWGNDSDVLGVIEARVRFLFHDKPWPVNVQRVDQARAVLSTQLWEAGLSIFHRVVQFRVLSYSIS